MDLSVHSDSVSEFLAIIIAGFGNELVPLTSEHGDEACPKALVPVANKPLVDYVLAWVEQSGIKDVMIICPSLHRHAISHHIHSEISGSLHIELHPYEESQPSPAGTCALLTHFSERILKDKQDFVVLPCDFMPPPSLPLSKILDKFRSDSIFEDSVATTCWFSTTQQDKGVFPDEWGSQSPSSIIWDAQSGTLLYMDSLAEIDHNPDTFKLKTSILSRYPRTRLSSRYQDSHVYVCRRSILDLLREKRSFDSFREDFLPWLCALQHSGSRLSKYASHLRPQRHVVDQETEQRSQGPRRDALSHSTLLNVSNPTRPSSLGMTVGLVLHDADNEYIARVNTLASLMEVNRQFLSKTTYSLPTDPKNRSLIDQKAQISSDTMVDVSTQIAERVVIKKSVIGKHCIIGKGARITGSVLLDHCVLEEGAKIEACILGSNTKIGVRAEVVKCVTQAGYEINEGETLKNEKLEVSDWTVGPDTTDSEETDDDDSE